MSKEYVADLDEDFSENGNSLYFDEKSEETILAINDEAKLRCCLPCTKIFKTKKEYNQHYQRKHVLGKQFSCQIVSCRKLFKTNFELKTHEKSHSNIKEFNCSYCNLQYKTKSTLDIHFKRKHSNL